MANGDKNWEKIVSWMLSMAATLALLVGAWFFSSLDEGLKTLKDEIGSLRIQIAVLKVSQDDLRSLENKTATKEQLNNVKEHFKFQIMVLREKLQSFEARLPN